MSAAIPTASRRLRGASLLLGASLLVWLFIEDQEVRPTLLFAALTCTLVAAWLAVTWRLSVLPRLLALPLLGLAAGLAVAPLAISFMIIKTGLHSHPTPDYTPEQIAWTLSRAPAWGIAGLLAGCSAVLWRLREVGSP